MYSSSGERAQEKTFDNEENLPQLPVPSLDKILAKYLDSVRQFLTSEEFNKTRGVVEEFRNGTGKLLYDKLQQYAYKKKNWIRDMTTSAWYLEPRCQIIPLNLQIVCIAFPSDLCKDYWTPKPGTQIERATLSLWYNLKLWQLIRTETLRPHRKANKAPLSMDQYRRLYSSCRIPGETRDWIKTAFKTESEGACPSHVVVLCKGRMFAFTVIKDQNEPITLSEIRQNLQHVRNLCDNEPEGPGIAILTADERTRWNKVRNNLMEVDEHNTRVLETIESCIMTLSLEDDEPKNYTEVGALSMMGNMTNRWCDKSFAMTVYKNGTVSYLAEHAHMDGLVCVGANRFVNREIRKCPSPALPEQHVDNYTFSPPVELRFQINREVEQAISLARSEVQETIKRMSVDILYTEYFGYGSDFIKSIGIRPQDLINICIQYAFYRTHGRFAPATTPISLRKFWHGRTAVLRPCTMEFTTWSRAMSDSCVPDETKKREFFAAVRKHAILHNEAEDGEDCDQLLICLAEIAKREGISQPPIFTDKAYNARGNFQADNFALVVVCMGLSPSVWAQTPYSKDGYHMAFSYTEKRVNFCCVSWKKSRLTDKHSFCQNVKRSLDDVRKLLEQNKAAPSTAAKL